MGEQYYRARLRAAKYNEGLATQAGAAEALDVDTATLGRWERGETVPSNHKVSLMAQVYGAPELRHNYCCYACPIGQARKMVPVDGRPIERTAIAIHNKIKNVSSDVDDLLEILQDGRIDNSERTEFKALVKRFSELEQRINALVIYADREGLREDASTED